MDAEEYVTLDQGMDLAVFLEDISCFEHLKLQLQINCYVIVCLCQSDPGNGSCSVEEGMGIVVD